MTMARYDSFTIMTTSYTVLVSIGNETVMPNSRKIVDLVDMEAARCQYKTNNDVVVKIEYSIDQGSNWATLIDETGLAGDNDPSVTTWQVVPEEAKSNEVLVRAVAVGNGLLTTISFVVLQYR